LVLISESPLAPKNSQDVESPDQLSVDNAERLRRFWRMVDERFKPADEAVAIFKAVYLRDGADAAVEVAKLVIGAAVMLIAHEHGPDEARRILDIVGAAQGQVS
jgi:hypothetical protein